MQYYHQLTILIVNTIRAYENLKSNRFNSDRVQGSYEEQELWMTRLDWIGIQLNKFEMFGEHENCLSRWKQCCSSWKQCWMKTMYK